MIVIDAFGKYPVVGAVALPPRRPKLGPQSEPGPSHPARLSGRLDCLILRAATVRSP